MIAYLPRAILFGILALIVMMALGVGWAVIAMTAVNPGQPVSSYMAGMETFYLIAGVPVLIVFAWLAARGAPPGDRMKVALAVAATCIVIELGVQLVSTRLGDAPWASLAVSIGVKLVAAAIGGWLASRQQGLASDDIDPT